MNKAKNILSMVETLVDNLSIISLRITMFDPMIV